MSGKKLTKKQVMEALDILDEMYPDAECALNHENPFQLICAVALSAQTTDKSVNQVTPELFKAFPTPEALACADVDEVAKYIRRIGMYKTKSKNLVNMAKMIVSDFGGEVPREQSSLEKLPGVGRKTANVVRSVAFGEQAIAVDTHVFRVSNRIGLVNEDNVLSTELSLMKAVPMTRWSKTHHSLIFHGRNICTARNPKCEECNLNNICKKNFR